MLRDRLVARPDITVFELVSEFENHPMLKQLCDGKLRVDLDVNALPLSPSTEELLKEIIVTYKIDANLPLVRESKS